MELTFRENQILPSLIILSEAGAFLPRRTEQLLGLRLDRLFVDGKLGRLHCAICRRPELTVRSDAPEKWGKFVNIQSLEMYCEVLPLPGFIGRRPDFLRQAALPEVEKFEA